MEALERKSKLDAVKSAAATRLRLVLMTSVATVCGHFPLTLVTGPGAAARKSIGLVLVAGMAIGTAFTLFFVLLARDHQKVPAPKEEEAPTRSPVESTRAHVQRSAWQARQLQREPRVAGGDA